MVHSMTAFARHEFNNEYGILTWECRSVNHRYLDMSIHLPETFRSIEIEVRKQVRKQLKRGKVDLSLFYHMAAQESDLSLNQALADQLLAMNQKLATTLGQHSYVNTMDILSWPNVLQSKRVDREALCSLAVQAVQKALEDLLAMREKEGGELAHLIQSRLSKIKQIVESIRPFQQDILDQQVQKMRKRIADCQLPIDNQRIEQEIVLLAQKMDVEEELDRLLTHTDHAASTLTAGGLMGRRLDFLMQEMHREANTLAAKSINADTTKASVDIKVLIEQMREQVQNIE